MGSEETITNLDSTTTHGSVWGGGVSPYAVVPKKLGMWLFIVSDAITFASLILAYGFVRLASENWPRPFTFWPSIVNATVMTVVLLSSSITVVMAVRASKMRERGAAASWLIATMLGGILFDVLHIHEWLGLIGEGVRLFRNPWGTPMFGASFFALTGLHMLHVTIGVVYLGVIAWGFGRSKYTADDVEISGLYWHFVDLVWMFLFPLLYLMSARTAWF
ncbi:MAG TPA: cytochrome c oxidase subunit 3 [Candidatus Sulfotelmatobacter sp.]|nr:cytochrome c oxidase subunit 3 [Candidatus Sulfotelmatobacter sp.]